MPAMPETPEKLTLAVPGDPQMLSLVRALVDLAGRRAGLDDAARYEVVVAVNEACSNVIEHAHGGDRSLTMTVECRVTEDGLQVVLRDRGAPYDFLSEPELDPTEVRQGGRGVFLIRRFFDALEWSPVDGGGNELRMLKRAARAPA